MCTAYVSGCRADGVSLGFNSEMSEHSHLWTGLEQHVDLICMSLCRRQHTWNKATHVHEEHANRRQNVPRQPPAVTLDLSGLHCYCTNMLPNTLTLI